MTQAQKALRFAALHERAQPFVLPNPWNAGTAKMFEHLGFEALATTSGGLAWSLGRQDGRRAVSRDEALANARDIVAATDLPVTADLENGYGDDPATVAETIALAAQAGLVGASIEDATGDRRRPIYPLDRAVERVAAAAQAARALPFRFMLVARAENFLHGINDLDDTLERLRRFAEAGADVLYAPLLPNADAVRRVCGLTQKPVNVLSAGWVLTTSIAALGALGVRRVSTGSGLARAALDATITAAVQMRENGRFDAIAGARPTKEIADLIGD